MQSIPFSLPVRCMMSAEQASSIQSQALSANLKETAGTVHVDPRFAPL